MGRHLKRRIPQLAYTENRGIGWHVNIRDPFTGQPRKIRFDTTDKREAHRLYNEWLSEHLKGRTKPTGKAVAAATVAKNAVSAPRVEAGSLLAVASSFLFHEERRVRKAGEARRPGTISPGALRDKRYDVKHFLEFMNRQHGQGAVGRLCVLDLSMHDVEAYNQELVDAGYSSVLVKNRMAAVRAIVDRASRPEHGEQILPWNWKAKDTYHGKASTPRKLPSLPQLQAILDRCDTRMRAIVWTAIGLGFGQGDLSAIRRNQIDVEGYDLRRGKTGLERYGDTPPGVWKSIAAYLKEDPRRPEELLFVTKNGEPLVHGETDSVHLWWRRTRLGMKKLGKGLPGFYVLRHVGATEFGSRAGCSLADMRRWLGHSASSSLADIYMRPVAPEHREMITFVRQFLTGGGG